MRAILFEVAVTALLSGATFGARAAQDPDEPVHDGKWLYTRNCSGCHNDNGDGKGATILQMGLTARDFKQGGFAFGDTPEQLAKTISTGIPGRSPMPSFKGVLSDGEIKLVIEYVQTLMPPRKDEKPKNTVMVVKDRPVIARGKLPAIAEGAKEGLKEIARGLLIGTPEGMTFEYDLDDVKLVGVRLGGFADRTDWRDRGGGYLEPLGQLVWEGEPIWPSIAVFPKTPQNAGALETTRCVLHSTWNRAGHAGLSYDVRDDYGKGRLLASLEESVATTTLSVGPAFRRSWRCRLDPSVAGIGLRLAGPLGEEWSHLHVHELEGGGVEVTDVRSDALKSSGGPGVGWTMFHFVPPPGSELTFSTTTIQLPQLDQALADRLLKEMAK